MAGVVGLALLLGWGFVSIDVMPPWPGFESSVQAVEDYVRSWGAWGVIVAILLMMLHSFLPFPAEFVGMANGMLYGSLWGTVVTWVGAMLGAYLAFGLARAFGRPLVQRLLTEHRRQQLDRLTRDAGGPTLLFSRFVPVISFNLINYAAGLTAISWWTFTWATALGILPLTLLIVLAGDGMVNGGTAWLWLVLAALAGWLVWWAILRRRKQGPG